MELTDSTLSHTNFGAILIQYVCIFGLIPVGIWVLRSDQHIGWTTGETSQVRGRQESFNPAMFFLGFQKRDSETVNRRIAGAVEKPPSIHSKPCLPSTGPSSHTATKTHFAPDEPQLWRWKHICSLRAAPAERLHNCSSVQARRNSKGPTEYSKLPVFFCAVAM